MSASEGTEIALSYYHSRSSSAWVFLFRESLNNDYIMSLCLYHRTIGREYFITPNTISRIWNSSKKYQIAKVNLCIISM